VSTLRRIGLAYNPTNPETPDVRERAAAWCAAHDIQTWMAEAEDHQAIGRQLADTDLVCIFGGDGTFLRAARAINGSRVPALGINLGRVGFLAKVEPPDLERTLDQVLAGDCAVEDRFRISATVLRADGGGHEEHACVIEVVVARGARVRMIQAEVEVSGSHLATYVADAVVVATPTGSTAYSFSAGGSILDPRLRNMIITPVAAYLSPLHSVVAGGTHVVRLTLRSAGNALVSLDGQADVPIRQGDSVEVSALDEPLRIIEPSGSTPFYDLLRTKAGLLPY
jgi:NAD+ kinase